MITGVQQILENLYEQNKKIHIISLGCARNRVDSEVMLGTLFERGWEHCDVADQADAILINTCGFIQSAKEESVDTILSSTELKQNNPDLKVIVAGCLTQRYKHQLSKALPEVDLFVGTDEFTKIGNLLENPPERGTVMAKRTHYLYHEAMPRVNTLGKFTAYIKVAEGCQHNCAFCIIPAIRGKLRSRPIESIVKEAQDLAATGVSEINLIAQDLAAYGRERGEDNLLPLLKELVKVEGIEWIRMLYVYPENISDEFLDFFARERKIVKYLDIPVQHASNNILKKMKRGVTREELKNTLEKVRSKVPDVAIRTSIMVGFPSETENDFNELKDFVTTMKFDHLGCFKYSQEEGTVAGRMPDQIDEETKERRLDEIMTIQKQISSETLKKYVGKTLPVLITGPSSESEFLMEGRLSIQAPEVDGVVLINDGQIIPGSIQQVKISESLEYDLLGQVVSP